MSKKSISQENKAFGTHGEATFKTWLDDSSVPYAYFEQGTLTFPHKLAQTLKRPDFLVGIIGLGSFAFDVKCVKLGPNGFNVSDDEIIRLARFQRYFNTTVFYAFIPQDPEDKRCCLISNDQYLMESDIQEGRHGRGNYRTAAPESADWVNLTEHTFLDALRQQIELSV